MGTEALSLCSPCRATTIERAKKKVRVEGPVSLSFCGAHAPAICVLLSEAVTAWVCGIYVVPAGGWRGLGGGMRSRRSDSVLRS